MKRFLALMAMSLMGVMLCASAILAAEVKTDYFTLTLPAGWKQPQPIQNINGGLAAIVQNTADKTAVSISIMPAPLPVKELATQTLANMKMGGFTVGEPRAAGDFYIGEFSQGNARGISYFGSNGKTGSVITILGATLDSGKELLSKHFTPADDKLFPSSF